MTQAPSPSRDLSAGEAALLRWLVEHGSSGSTAFIEQTHGLSARPSCSCGCPSISLEVEDNRLLGEDSCRVLADFAGATLEGQEVGAMLFQQDGKLSELEIYAYDYEGEFGLPTIDSLTPYTPHLFGSDDQPTPKSPSPPA